MQNIRAVSRRALICPAVRFMSYHPSSAMQYISCFCTCIRSTVACTRLLSIRRPIDDLSSCCRAVEDHTCYGENRPWSS